jgi:Flp pilus assembly protein TadB
MKEFIPILGMLTGIIIPLIVFVWLYLVDKNKNETMREMAKHIKDPEEIKALMKELNNDGKPQKSIDYRRSGVITLFVGIGLFLFGVFFLGPILKGVGALVAAIGIGQIIAGYIYPRESEEISEAVEDFEER